ncbi:MAG: hypothetical protein ACRYFS_22815 [Janthinobacterium lividum]
MSREDRLKGDMDFYTQIPRSLLHAPLNRGQVDMLAFFRARCNTYGYCQRDKAITDFLSHYNEAKSKRHMKPETAQRYLCTIMKTARVMEVKAVNGRIYLIADESPVRMREVMERFQADLREGADYQTDLRRVQAEKAAQDEAAWADLLAYNRAENAEPAGDAEGTDFFASESENFAEGAENDADKAENSDSETAKCYGEFCKVLHENESKTGGESSSESSLEPSIEDTNETTTTSTAPCVVEESRVRADAAEDVVVFSSFDVFEEDQAQEQAADDVNKPPVVDASSAATSALTEEIAPEAPLEDAGPQVDESQAMPPVTLPAPPAPPMVLSEVPAPQAPAAPQKAQEASARNATDPCVIDLVTQLRGEGMGKAQAETLALTEYEECHKQLENLRDALPTEQLKPSRGGWIFGAITQGYGPTKGHEAKLKQEAKKQAARVKMEAKWAEQDAKAAKPMAILAEVTNSLTAEEEAELRQRARNCVHPDFRKRKSSDRLIEQNYLALVRGEKIKEYCVWEREEDSEVDTAAEAEGLRIECTQSIETNTLTAWMNGDDWDDDGYEDDETKTVLRICTLDAEPDNPPSD